MIQEYLNKTHTEMSTNIDKYSKVSKPKKNSNPLIYNNIRNSTGLSFKKKKSLNKEFVNSDIRSISVPFDATKSSENISSANVRGILDRKRASTTDKFGPRNKKILPKIGEGSTDNSQQMPLGAQKTEIQTLERYEEYPEGTISEVPKSNGFISRNNNKTHSFGMRSTEKNI